MGDRIYHSPFTLEQIRAAEGKGPIIQKVGNVGYWCLWNIEEMRYVQTEYPALIGDINEISSKVNQVNVSAGQAAQSASEAETSAENAEAAAQRAEEAAKRSAEIDVVIGPSSLITELPPRTILFCTDGDDVVPVVAESIINEVAAAVDRIVDGEPEGVVEDG